MTNATVAIKAITIAQPGLRRRRRLKLGFAACPRSKRPRSHQAPAGRRLEVQHFRIDVPVRRPVGPLEFMGTWREFDLVDVAWRDRLSVNVKAVDQRLNPRYIVGEMGKISRKQGGVDTRRHLVPRPVTFAAFRTAGDAAGCVLVLDARQVRLRPASFPAPPLTRPQHRQRYWTEHECRSPPCSEALLRRIHFGPERCVGFNGRLITGV